MAANEHKNRIINIDGYEKVECSFVMMLDMRATGYGGEVQLCMWRRLDTGRSFEGALNEGTEVN